MPYLSEIKKEMEFYDDFAALTETLKNLALFRFHTFQKELKLFELFPEVLGSFFNMIDIKNLNHPFLQEKEGGTLGVVAVTSDTGLLGGLNNRVMNVAIGFMKDRDAKIIIVGRQGQKYVQGMNIPVATFPGVEEEKRASQAIQLRNYIIKELAHGNLHSVKIVYPHAFSLTSQKIEALTLLPFSERLKDTSEVTKSYSPILFESSPSDLVEYLGYLWIGQRIYEAFGLSHLAEYAARYIHLEESIDRIKEDIKKLKLKYFKIRHEIIDQQMRELSAAKAILAK